MCRQLQKGLIEAFFFGHSLLLIAVMAQRTGDAVCRGLKLWEPALVKAVGRC